MDKEYGIRYKEKISNKHKKYYQINREKLIEKACQYAKDNREKHNEKGKIFKRKLKEQVFNYYSCGTMQCNHCGKTDIDILSIDHINDNGAKHREELGLGRHCGHMFYYWLKKNNFPEGYQILCYSCQYRKRFIQMRPKNPTSLQITRQNYIQKIKMECLNAYGECCCPCGENDIVTLTLDHVNDDGFEHRKNLNTRGGYQFYLFLRKNNFPKDPPLQILCMNCQMKKRFDNSETQK